MFDQLDIYDKIQELADRVLVNGATQKSLELFVEKVKEFAEDQLESHFFSRSEDETILSLVNKDEYLNFSTGYLTQMRKWQREHPIKIDVHYSNIEETCTRAGLSTEDSKFVKRHLIETGIGTIVSIGIGMIIPGIGGIIAGIIAEIIVLLIVKNRYERSKAKYENLAEEKIKMDLLLRRNSLVENVTSDIKKWMEAAEKQSDLIEKTFLK